MKMKQVGWAVLGGLLAVGLTACATAQNTQAPEGSEEAVVQAQDEGPAAEQAAVDEQADAEATEATAEQEAASPAPLEIVDSGWFASDNGMIDFAVEVQNPNHTVEATDAVIEVVGKDGDGNVLFDETIETPGVLPDSTYYYSYVAGSTTVEPTTGETQATAPATVDFTISTPDGAWKATDQKLADVYTVQDNGATDTQFGAKEFTGTVTASENLDGTTQSRVDVVLLDGDGHIEGGYFKIVDTTAGQPADYDIYAVGAPQYASYAVYASPWSDPDAEADAA